MLSYPGDQSAYSHLVDNHLDALSLTLFAGSILSAGVIKSNKGKLDFGVADRGAHLDFTKED